MRVFIYERRATGNTAILGLRLKLIHDYEYTGDVTAVASFHYILGRSTLSPFLSPLSPPSSFPVSYTHLTLPTKRIV